MAVIKNSESLSKIWKTKEDIRQNNTIAGLWQKKVKTHVWLQNPSRKIW